MKVWLFVEGESDRLALSALWHPWLDRLKLEGHGIKFLPLESKAKFFRKIGHRVAEKLKASDDDIAVGLPDLYPNAEFAGSPYCHDDINELRDVQTRLVTLALHQVFGMRKREAEECTRQRFHPSALSHDLEMLLLAARDQLRNHLRTRDQLGGWRHPVESQNQTQPPRRIIEDLFRTKCKRKYSETTDAMAILGKVSDLRTILFNDAGQLQCSVFKGMVDWVGQRTGVPAY